jgi:hypothetical protein
MIADEKAEVCQAREREVLTLPISANIVWSIDFMHDRLANDVTFDLIAI